MFVTPVLRTFWDMAAAGQLRTRGVGEDRPMPVASLRIVRDCLAILAERVVPGRAVWLPSISQQDPKAIVPAAQLGVLYRRLVDMALDAPVERAGIALSMEDRVRLLAIVAVVLDTGARSGELETMRVDDFTEGLGRVRVRRVPQNGVHLAYDDECVLRDGTRVALRRWLAVRDDLMAGLEGGRPAALWVGLQANQWMPHKGLPLRAQGIRKAYARGAVALNGVMAGRYGWEPLPTRLEQLRRAVPVAEAPAVA
jgi:integrase